MLRLQSGLAAILGRAPGCQRETFVFVFRLHKRANLFTQSRAHNNDVTKVDLLEHIEYSDMRDKLEAEEKNGSIGPLGKVCKHILDCGLRVVEKMLFLNALSLTSPNNSRSITTFSGIRAMKKSGEIVVGDYTALHDKEILLQYQILKSNTQVEDTALKSELFARGDRNQKEFMMQRQLVGFYLMQDLPDQERRLPIEVYGRLAVLLFSGAFTEEEDKAILNWVDEHGLTKWNALARTLGRNYAQGGMAVKSRYHMLKDRTALHPKTSGKFKIEELEEIMEDVLSQTGGRVDTNLPKGVDWDGIASKLNRATRSVYDVYRGQIHPVLLQYLSGTLDSDPRESLLKVVKRKGWVYSALIDYSELVKMPVFEGHTSRSLHKMYNNMQHCTRNKLKLSSGRDVTIHQVLDWWNGAGTHDRWRSKADRDSKIIEAYCRIMNLPQPSISETSQTWCSHCERHFKYLKAHMKLHKSKPHQCNICKRLFAEPSQLEEHMRIYHLEEEKLFSCNNCGKGFPTKQRLKQHLKVHDKES